MRLTLSEKVHYCCWVHASPRAGDSLPTASWPMFTKHHLCFADTQPLSRNELEVLISEAGGHLLTDLPAAVAAAEARSAADAAAAFDASQTAGADSSQAAAAAAPRPSVYVLSSGLDGAEVADLQVRLQKCLHRRRQHG